MLSRRVYCPGVPLLCLPTVFGQFIAQTVMVGANGSFYEPETISAGLNNIVRFIFVGTSHSVVQTSFDNPCIQLPGGFSSGVAGANVSTTPPVWDLVVTNDSQPIWFYCANTLPSFHCTSGMVGAINPPSIPAYDQFKASAKIVSTVPTTFPTKALFGQGATATAFPAVPSSTSPSLTPTPSSSVSTTPPTPASAALSNKAAIIGGSVGGAVALMAAAILLAWSCRDRRRRKQERNSRDFFNYNVRSPQHSNFQANDIPTLSHMPADPFVRAPISIQPSPSNETMSTTTLVPNRLESMGRKYRVTNNTISVTTHPTGSVPLVKEQKSFLNLQASAASSLLQESPPPDMHMLAREVAAIMMQNTLDTRTDAASDAPPSYAINR